MSLEKRDWDGDLFNVITSPQNHQLERDQFDQQVLDFVNHLVIPSDIIFNFTEIEVVAQILLIEFGDDFNFEPTINGILVRSTRKWREVFLWNLQKPLATEEKQRRTLILDSLTYRRSILKTAYSIISGLDWSQPQGDFMQSVEKAQIDAQSTDFKDDYSDLLE